MPTASPPDGRLFIAEKGMTVSIYEDPDYIDSLAQEAVEEDQGRTQVKALTLKLINEVEDEKTKIALRSILFLITQIY